MGFDEKYFNSYAKSLLELPIEEFEKSLPNELQSGYIECMNKLLEYISLEVSATNEVRGSCVDLEDIEYLNSEIEKFQKMKSIIEGKISSIADELPKSNFDIVFLKSKAGNEFIFRDLKSIPEEYYNALFELFNELKKLDFSSGEFSMKVKNLDSDKRFDHVLEFKVFKLRIYFRILSNDTLLLLQAYYKTQTNPALLKDTLASRNQFANKCIDELRADLNSSEKSLEIKKENSKVEEDVYEYLKQNKRGSK